MNAASRRGFTLIELLVALILLGAFALVAGRLLRLTIMLTQSSAEGHNAAASFSAATSALRADVWAARDVAVDNKQAVTITLEGDRKITWAIEAVSIARTEANETERWTAPPQSTFAADGPELILTAPDSRTSRGGELRFVNHAQIVTTLTIK